MTAPERSVLCFGDSNTHGTMALRDRMDRRRFPFHERWPGVLQATLGPTWRVVEEGHPGRTTVHSDPVQGDHKSGIVTLPALLESHRPLDAVVVMLGTNDLQMRFSVTPFDIALSVERLCVMAQDPLIGANGKPAHIVIVSPVPVDEVGFLGEPFTGAAAKSRALAEKLKASAEFIGASFLDAGLLAAADPDDGIHLTAEGQAAIGRAVAERLEAVFT
ncbi:MAG: GDSL-type esterase/lipase family protein [Pseudomonadota bacterium]